MLSNRIARCVRLVSGLLVARTATSRVRESRRLCAGFEQVEERCLLAGGGIETSCEVVPNIDFNGDWRIDARDVLTVITNMANHGGSYRLSTMDGQWSSIVDANFDGWITPLDALITICYINQNGPTQINYSCVDTVTVQYNQLGDIIVAPGTTNVLVASVTMTSQNNEYVFPNRVTVNGGTDLSVLSSDGQFVGMTWGEWKDMGLSNQTLGPWSSRTFELRADIPQDASGQLDYSLSNWGFQTFPGATVKVSELNGNDRTVYVQSPKFTVEMAANTPASSMVAGGQTVTACDLNVTATGIAYTVTEAKFTVPAGSSMVIASASLLDGGTVLANAAFVNDQVYFTGLNVVLQANTSKTLTLHYVLVASLPNEGMNSGLNVKSTLYSIKVFGANGVQSKLLPGVSGNDLYVYKSVPTFSQVPVPSVVLNDWNGSSVWLYGWNVSASQWGSIGQKQMTFDINWRDLSNDSNLSMNDFRVLRDGVDITSSVMIYDEDGHNLKGAGTATEDSSKVYVIWDPLEVVSAGTTVRYLLKATPHGFQHANGVQGDDGIFVQPAMDSAVNIGKYVYWTNTGPMTSLVLAQKNDANPEVANIIWTDLSSWVQDPSSGDFANGHLLPGVTDLALNELFGE